jgi:hypothetical protein
MISDSLPDPVVSPFQVPKVILSTLMRKQGDAEVAQVLVKWSNMSSKLATWKDKEALMQQFPAAPAWGQAGFQDPRDVSATTSFTLSRPRRSKKANTHYSGRSGLGESGCTSRSPRKEK